MDDPKGKLFSVERRAHQRGHAARPRASAGASDGSFEEALLTEIAGLRREMSALRLAVGAGGGLAVGAGAGLAAGAGGEPQSSSDPAVDDTGTGQADAAAGDIGRGDAGQGGVAAGALGAGREDGHDIDHDLRVEIAQMVRSIGRAKTHIAAIKHPMSDEDQMQTASLQLDTIMQTTETATNEIMGSVDAIEGNLKEINGFTLDDPEVQQLVDQASNHLIAIIEACSFQDLTGQRINQVVKTLRFIESRILAMIDIWGGLEAFRDLPIPEDTESGEREVAPEEESLLNGPALGGAGLSQEDIDALFD